MNNYIQSGAILEYTPESEPVFSGGVVQFGARIGVAVADIMPGETGAVRVRGVVELPKAAGAALEMGAEVQWTGEAIAAGSGAGYAAAPAAADAATVLVQLNG